MSSRGMSQLAMVFLSLAAAKTILRLALTVILLAAVAVWISTRETVDGLDSSETSRKAAEAIQMAEEARQIVDEAHEKAAAMRNDSLIRQQKSTVQSSVQMTALAVLAWITEQSVSGDPRFDDLTISYDELYQYGWRRNPDMVYEDIELFRSPEGSIDFKIVVRHRNENRFAYMYDSASGQGVSPME